MACLNTIFVIHRGWNHRLHAACCTYTFTMYIVYVQVGILRLVSSFLCSQDGVGNVTICCRKARDSQWMKTVVARSIPRKYEVFCYKGNSITELFTWDPQINSSLLANLWYIYLVKGPWIYRSSLFQFVETILLLIYIEAIDKAKDYLQFIM